MYLFDEYMPLQHPSECLRDVRYFPLPDERAAQQAAHPLEVAEKDHAMTVFGAFYPVEDAED